MNSKPRKMLYVFRHGETDWNRDGRFQGHTDIPLNETGRAQARALIPHFQAHQVEAILTSDLVRARETAGIIAGELKIPVVSDPGLREAHLGAAEGLLFEEIEELFGEELVLGWRSHRMTDIDVCYPGGETGRQVMARVFGAIEAFLAAAEHEKVGISTHGGVIRRIMQRIFSEIPGGVEGFKPVPIPNGVLYILSYEKHQNRFELVSPDPFSFRPDSSTG